MTFKIIASISRFLLLRDSYTAVFYHRVIPLTALWSSKKTPTRCKGLDFPVCSVLSFS